jgi:hypothetical protein
MSTDLIFFVILVVVAVAGIYIAWQLVDDRGEP